MLYTIRARLVLSLVSRGLFAFRQFLGVAFKGLFLWVLGGEDNHVSPSVARSRGLFRLFVGVFVGTKGTARGAIGSNCSVISNLYRSASWSFGGAFFFFYRIGLLLLLNGLILRRVSKGRY